LSQFFYKRINILPTIAGGGELRETDGWVIFFFGVVAFFFFGDFVVWLGVAVLLLRAVAFEPVPFTFLLIREEGREAGEISSGASRFLGPWILLMW
jgi:hypothetical protein